MHYETRGRKERERERGERSRSIYTSGDPVNQANTRADSQLQETPLKLKDCSSSRLYIYSDLDIWLRDYIHILHSLLSSFRYEIYHGLHRRITILFDNSMDPGIPLLPFESQVIKLNSPVTQWSGSFGVSFIYVVIIRGENVMNANNNMTETPK